MPSCIVFRLGTLTLREASQVQLLGNRNEFGRNDELRSDTLSRANLRAYCIGSVEWWACHERLRRR